MLHSQGQCLAVCYHNTEGIINAKYKSITLHATPCKWGFSVWSVTLYCILFTLPDQKSCICMRVCWHYTQVLVILTLHFTDNVRVFHSRTKVWMLKLFWSRTLENCLGLRTIRLPLLNKMLRNFIQALVTWSMIVLISRTYITYISFYYLSKFLGPWKLFSENR